MPAAGYDAFISYSHEEREMAEHFHSAIQRFARPWYRTRSFRVFLDTANLAAESVLRKAIEAALDQSRVVILLASRSAARSPWVEQELRYWLASHPPESIILVRLNGTIRWRSEEDDFDWSLSDAVPPVLKARFRREPLFADVSTIASLSLRDPAFRHAVAQVAARLRNVPLDEILGEHLRRRRQAQLATAALTVLVTLLSVVSVVSYRRSLFEQRAEEQQTMVALSRRLAAQSRAALVQRDTRLSLLLGIAGVRSAGTNEARGALIEALVATEHMVADFQASNVPVAAVGLSAAKGLLITGDNNGTVAFWDLATLKELARHTGVHPGGVTDIAVSPDGRLAASGSDAHGFILWDLARLGQIESTTAGPGFCLAFTQDGKALLAGGRSGVVSVWDLQADRVAVTRSYPSEDTVIAIADAGSGRIVTGSVTGVVRILDRATLQSMGTLNPAPATGSSIDVADDHRLLAMAGGHAARLWDLIGNEPYDEPFISSGGMVTKASFVASTPPYTVALAVGSDLQLWSTDLETLGFHRDIVMSLAPDYRRALLASGSLDGRARVWALYPNNAFVTVFRPPERHLVGNAVALNANGSILAVGASDARINAQFKRISSEASLYIVNPSTGELLQSPLKGHRKAIIDLAFSSTGMLASASDDGTVLLWDLSKQGFVTVSSSGERALAIEFSPNGRLLAFAQADGPAGVWGVEEGRLFWRSETNDITAITFSPDGAQLATGTAKGEVRLRAVRDGTERTVLRSASGGGIDRLKYDRSGRRLLALIDGNLSVIDVENQQARPWPSAGERVRDFAIGPSSVVLLQVSGRLSLWNLGSGERIADLHRASSGDFFIPIPQSVAVSADDDHIAATLPGGTSIFNLANGEMESRACRVAGGPLTHAEWAAVMQKPYTAICPDH